MPTVMLVDDSEEFRAPVAAALKKRGFEVLSLGGGAEALRKLEGGTIPDLMILDMVMPNVDGIQVLRTMRQRSDWFSIPVFLLTAQDSEAILIRARELGATCLLKYCITIDELCRRVRATIPAHAGATTM